MLNVANKESKIKTFESLFQNFFLNFFSKEKKCQSHPQSDARHFESIPSSNTGTAESGIISGCRGGTPGTIPVDEEEVATNGGMSKIVVSGISISYFVSLTFTFKLLLFLRYESSDEC